MRLRTGKEGKNGGMREKGRHGENQGLLRMGMDEGMERQTEGRKLTIAVISTVTPREGCKNVVRAPRRSRLRE